jgi:hypothetical protein
MFFIDNNLCNYYMKSVTAKTFKAEVLENLNPVVVIIWGAG